jgi:TetR/AcrR family fatty acid metabolism transcriptional regulator
VFARSGFYETRMAEIAREAGVGVGTLYNYFESKEVIFSDLLALRHTQFRAIVDAAAISREPLERLRQIVRSALGVLDDNGALFAVFMERGAVGEFDVERLVGASAERDYGEFLDLLDKTVRAAVRAKKLRGDVEPRLLVSALSGAMNGATYAWLKRGRRGRLSSVADDLLDLFLLGAVSR